MGFVPFLIGLIPWIRWGIAHLSGFMAIGYTIYYIAKGDSVNAGNSFTIFLAAFGLAVKPSTQVRAFKK